MLIYLPSREGKTLLDWNRIPACHDKVVNSYAINATQARSDFIIWKLGTCPIEGISLLIQTPRAIRLWAEIPTVVVISWGAGPNHPFRPCICIIDSEIFTLPILLRRTRRRVVDCTKCQISKYYTQQYLYVINGRDISSHLLVQTDWSGSHEYWSDPVP